MTMMPAERTIHIVEDDAAVRRSLERLLDAAGFATASYRSALEFLAAAPGLSPGCLLLDLRMPVIDGFALQARLADIGFRMPIIVVTAQGDVPNAVRAMKAGAVDFIEKPYDDGALIGAIEAALAAADGDGRAGEIAEARRRIASLSPREREVLDALVAGRPNKMIAYDLGLSVRTVEVHRARMMERLGVRQLAEAIRLAVLATMA
jgi:two-component system, LuxR family, response regulator FixJ